MSKRIHFMGIGGSGMSAVAQIAQAQGYQVSGCDLQTNTPYLEQVKKSGIQVFTGHSDTHLTDTDLLCVTPAAYFISPDSPEFRLAKKKHILITWQDFMGTHLHKDKYLICVAGTHGKSTVTALAGLLLEKAGLDPTVEVGAIVNTWQNNMRLGKGKYFISEADEYHDNFKTYRPDIILLTLVEYDHPEYFGTPENMLQCYQRFINRLKPNGQIIYNADSPLALKLKFPENSRSYRLTDFPKDLILSQPGIHNKLNALAIIRLGESLGINRSVVYSVLHTFTGLERRLELIGKRHGIKVYDDYANHPSSYAASISAIHQLNPTQKIIAVIEPHTFSRLRVMLNELPAAFKDADEVIVSKIFASREKDPGDFTGQDIVNALHHPHAIYIPEFPSIVRYLKSKIQDQDVILVMGSGNSYKLSRQILENL